MAAGLENPIAHARELCEGGSWRELLSFAQQWHLEAPNDPKPLFYQGVALAIMGRFVEAETAYRRTLNLDPNEAIAGSTTPRTDYRRTLNLDPNEAKATKSPRTKFYRRTLNLDPNEARAWNNLGAILFEALKRRDDGIQCLVHSLKLDPGNKLGWANLASMQGQMGRHQQALECAERALALDPEMIEALLHRGRAAQHLGNAELLATVCESLAGLPAEKFRRAH